MGALKKHKMRAGGYSGRPANPTAKAAVRLAPAVPYATRRFKGIDFLGDPGVLVAVLRPLTPRL